MNWAVAWQNQQNGMCAQQRLRSAWASAQSDQGCTGWSEFSLCAQWIAKEPSFLHADSEDWSDWADAQAHLSLCWAHKPFCWFYREAAQFTWREMDYRSASHSNPGQTKIIFCSFHTGSIAHVFVCPRFFHRYVILTGQSNLSINFRVRLIAFFLLYCKLLVIMPYWGIGYVMISTSIIIWRCHILPWMPR